MANGLSELVNDSQAMIGQSAPDVPQGVKSADWSSIQNLCSALGDVNPLYNDAAKGVGTIFNTLIAPPSYIFSIRTPDSGAAYEGKAYGLRRFSTKASAQWNDVIRLGQPLVSDLKVTAVRDGGKLSGRDAAEVDSTATYSTVYGGALASATGTVSLVPYEPSEALIDDRDIHVYSDEEIKNLEDDLDAMQPHRGQVPLYWSEVNEGDMLPSLVKGPVSYNEISSWRLAEAKPSTALIGVTAHDYLVARPGRITANPSTLWPYFDVEQAYGDILAVKSLGFKMPVTRGLMRFALASQVLTNWMGDLGFLRSMSLDLPNHFFYEDTLWLDGEVTKKFKENVGMEEYNAVEVKLSGRNQLGDTLVDGNAVVYLPERGFLVGLPIGNPWS